MEQMEMGHPEEVVEATLEVVVEINGTAQLGVLVQELVVTMEARIKSILLELLELCLAIIMVRSQSLDCTRFSFHKTQIFYATVNQRQLSPQRLTAEPLPIHIYGTRAILSHQFLDLIQGYIA